MPDQREHWIFLRSELDRLPKSILRQEDVDSGIVPHAPHAFDVALMDDQNLMFHHASKTHAASLTVMGDMLRQAWFDAELKLRGTTIGEADDEVELAFADRLSRWLRDHAGYVERVAAGGDVEPGQVKAGPGRTELYIAAHRLYAERHYEVIADYCDRMATLLEHRITELRMTISAGTC